MTFVQLVENKNSFQELTSSHIWGYPQLPVMLEIYHEKHFGLFWGRWITSLDIPVYLSFSCLFSSVIVRHYNEFRFFSHSLFPSFFCIMEPS